MSQIHFVLTLSSHKPVLGAKLITESTMEAAPPLHMQRQVSILLGADLQGGAKTP